MNTLTDVLAKSLDLIKAKGDQKSGHKYKSRKPDGKGGWNYDYGSEKQKQKLIERLTKLGANPKEAKRDVDKHFDDLAPYKDASISKQAEVIASLAASSAGGDDRFTNSRGDWGQPSKEKQKQNKKTKILRY